MDMELLLVHRKSVSCVENFEDTECIKVKKISLGLSYTFIYDLSYSSDIVSI